MKQKYRRVKESATLSINMHSRVLEQNGQTVYKFGFGQSPFEPPVGVINALRDASQATNYTHVQGNEDLRACISKFHQDANGIESSVEDIFVASGSKILLYAILLSVENADVLIPAPSWVTYRPQVKLCGHNAIDIETNYEERWRVTPENIEQAYGQKQKENTIMILNSPGNPDGLSYSESEIKAIAATAKKLDILVIADEIYGLLNFAGSYFSLANYYPEGTITTTGLSKWCGAGGWRLGVAIIGKSVDPGFKKAMIGVASETYSCAPSPVQHAAKGAYSSYAENRPYLEKQKNILRIVAAYCHEKLSDSGVMVQASEGGFYLFPDFSNFKEKLRDRGITTSGELCEKLLQETGVALLPGIAFGMPASHLVARLAYVDFDDPLEKKVFNLERDCPRIIAGIQTLCDWLP